ncbi:MAG: hypothetical protein PHC75_06695 [Burkholderiales bacterium]|nr:hypothetical protein [Burkholderiales bacterium]
MRTVGMKEVMPEIRNNEINDIFSNKRDLQYMYNLAVEKFHIGDYKRAHELIGLVYTLDKNISSQYLKTYGAILQAIGDYAQAVSMYESAFNLERNNENACLFYTGVCLFKLGSYEQSQHKLTIFLAEGNKNTKLLSRAKLYLKLINNKQKA